MKSAISKQTLMFQALGDESRLRMIRLLARNDEECCLCELVDSLLEPKYKLSRHLKVLRQAGLLSARKDGRWVYHRIDEALPNRKQLLAMIVSLPDPKGVYAADVKRLKKRMDLREDGCCRMGIQNLAYA